MNILLLISFPEVFDGQIGECQNEKMFSEFLVNARIFFS